MLALLLLKTYFRSRLLVICPQNVNALASKAIDCCSEVGAVAVRGFGGVIQFFVLFYFVNGSVVL